MKRYLPIALIGGVALYLYYYNTDNEYTAYHPTMTGSTPPRSDASLRTEDVESQKRPDKSGIELDKQNSGASPTSSVLKDTSKVGVAAGLFTAGYLLQRKPKNQYIQFD